MKAIYWILAAAVLASMLAYTVIKDRHAACLTPQLSQVLK